METNNRLTELLQKEICLASTYNNQKTQWRKSLNTDKLDLMKVKEEKGRKGIKVVLIFTGLLTLMQNMIRSGGFQGSHRCGDVPDNVGAEGGFLIVRLEVLKDTGIISPKPLGRTQFQTHPLLTRFQS